MSLPAQLRIQPRCGGGSFSCIDVVPVHDYGVRKGFAKTYRKKDLPKPAELLEHGERWRPFRSVASWYLWRALKLE